MSVRAPDFQAVVGRHAETPGGIAETLHARTRAAPPERAARRGAPAGTGDGIETRRQSGDARDDVLVVTGRP